MNKSAWQIGAVALLSASLLAGCGGGSGGGSATKKDNELVVGRVEPVDGLSGDSCIGGGSIQTMPMLYDSLLRTTQSGSDIGPGLAKAYTYDAKAKTYTLELRDDASFSNGQPLTAADVVFSIDQWVAGTGSGAYYDMIKSATAKDASTVVIDLTREDTFLPALLTWCTSTVYPKDFAGQTADQFFEKPIGAGPYALVSWRNPGASETLTLERNKGWYGAAKKEPYIDKIVLKTSADSAQQVLAFQAGELDVIEDLGSDDASQLPASNLESSKPSYSYDLMLNAKSPALKDPLVRQAISLAIDRDELAKVQTSDVVAAVGMIPVNVPNSVPGDTPYTTDLDAAKALLAQRSDGGAITIDLGFEGATSTVKTVANLLQQQLKKIDITVKLKPTDQATIYSQAGKGDFDAVISGVAAISPSAFDPIGFLMAAWYPWTGSDTSVIAKEYARGTSTFDDAERDDAVRAIQEDAYRQSTVIGLFNQPSVYAVAPYVKGLVSSQYRYWDSAVVKIDEG